MNLTTFKRIGWVIAGHAAIWASIVVHELSRSETGTAATMLGVAQLVLAAPPVLYFIHYPLHFFFSTPDDGLGWLLKVLPAWASCAVAWVVVGGWLPLWVVFGEFLPRPLNAFLFFVGVFATAVLFPYLLGRKNVNPT